MSNAELWTIKADVRELQRSVNAILDCLDADVACVLGQDKTVLIDREEEE